LGILLYDPNLFSPSELSAGNTEVTHQETYIKKNSISLGNHFPFFVTKSKLLSLLLFFMFNLKIFMIMSKENYDINSKEITAIRGEEVTLPNMPVREAIKETETPPSARTIRAHSPKQGSLIIRQTYFVLL